jgi:hypothetical protein
MQHIGSRNSEKIAYCFLRRTANVGLIDPGVPRLKGPKKVSPVEDASHHEQDAPSPGRVSLRIS